MPKRSYEEKINYYSAKLKKLQTQQLTKKRRRRAIIYSSSDSEDNLDNGTQLNENASASPPPPEVERSTSPSPGPSAPAPAPETDPEPEPEPELELDQAAPSSSPPPSAPIPITLDSELLEALGDPAEENPVYGPEIHAMLAERWLPILKKGLKPEAKEKLLKEYTVPMNLKLLKAPTLNAELRAAVPDLAKNRDKKLQIEQDYLGLGITAINRAMTVLLTQDNKVEAVKILSDACRILSDLHFGSTQVRKKLLTRGLDKTFLSNIEEQERDETLFGLSLPEKIKEVKAIEKQGKEIKKTPTPRASTSNASTQPLVSRSRSQGNWSGPPRYPTSSRGGRSSQYRNQYQYRGGAVTLAPPAFPAPAHPAPRGSSSTTTTAPARGATRRAPTRH